MCYKNIHEHTCTALGCRPNCTCKLWILTSNTCKSVCSMSGKTDYIVVTNMLRLDQGHLHPLPEEPWLACPGRKSNPGLRTLAKGYSNSLFIAIRYTWSRDTIILIQYLLYARGTYMWTTVKFIQYTLCSPGWSNSKLQTSTWFPPN